MHLRYLHITLNRDWWLMRRVDEEIAEVKEIGTGRKEVKCRGNGGSKHSDAKQHSSPDASGCPSDLINCWILNGNLQIEAMGFFAD